jgi:hypothetical protein
LQKIELVNYPKYETVDKSTESMQFEFISTGTKDIKKVVQYSQTNNPDIFNLGFGDLILDKYGEPKLDERGDFIIDDEKESNNGDRNVVLATVASTAYNFSQSYPDKIISFYGNTPAKQRLYRIAICKELVQLNNDWHIYGVINHGGQKIAEPFQKNKNYELFLFALKN